MSAELITLFRTMTPEQKLRIALRLYYSASTLKASALRSQNPNLSEEVLSLKLREIFLHARS
ncbi:MAG: hypothetical protein GX443_00340 [Deltaproteobacteria bacterium]|nr:hypothetical protein [Deltaproteobacteria bacterium]